MSIEKYRSAVFWWPSPSVMETRALPPVLIIKPKDVSIIVNGIIMFTAAKGVLPTKLDMKNPSTTE